MACERWTIRGKALIDAFVRFQQPRFEAISLIDARDKSLVKRIMEN